MTHKFKHNQFTVAYWRNRAGIYTCPVTSYNLELLHTNITDALKYQYVEENKVIDATRDVAKYI